MLVAPTKRRWVRMAIRYAAPSMFQPNEREMRQSDARRQNMFNVGRNLSRAFLRQNAIDNAMFQQNEERGSRERLSEARSNLQQQEAARQKQQTADRAAAAQRQADQLLVSNMPMMAAADSIAFTDRAGANYSDFMTTPEVNRALNDPNLFNNRGSVFSDAPPAVRPVGQGAFGQDGQRYSGETVDRLQREQDARAQAAGLLERLTPNQSAPRVRAILDTQQANLGPDHPNVQAAVAAATNAARAAEARDRDFAEFFPGPFTLGSYGEIDASVPADLRARPNILADEVLTSSPFEEFSDITFGDQEPMTSAFALRVLSQLPSHLSDEEKLYVLNLARQRQQAGRGR